MELKKTLQRIKRIASDPCVSILLTTHRTHPANAQDPINLKNLLNEAEERLLGAHDKRHAGAVIERLRDAAAAIDHQTNMEGLAIFANTDMAEVVKLPVAVTDRVIIDRNFATRDLIRAVQGIEHYLILTISGHQSRLIEAYRDQVITEFGPGHPFPIANRLYNTHADQRSQANTEENLMREFCNRVDKAMQEVQSGHALPVILAGDERNLAFFLEVADRRERYIGRITGSPDERKANELTTRAFAEVQRIADERRTGAMDRIGKAQGAGLLLDDLGDIHRAVREGRGDTLFVEEGYFQPAHIHGDVVTLHTTVGEPGVIDDLVDEVAEEALRHGGHVVFLPSGSLEKLGKACLVARY